MLTVLTVLTTAYATALMYTQWHNHQMALSGSVRIQVAGVPVLRTSQTGDTLSSAKASRALNHTHQRLCGLRGSRISSNCGMPEVTVSRGYNK